MWLSLNIISRMVDISDLDPREIAMRLIMSTAEIESIEEMNPFLADIVAARITGVSPHPNADKLTLCDCDTGTESLRVVCGAPNHKKGDIVPLALVGTKFNEEFIVRKTKIRGQESVGMLCSEREMGLSDDHSGIMILPENTPLGTSMSTLFPNRVDTLFEIDNKTITHRPDLWSHSGFAREIAALFGRKFAYPVDFTVLDDVKGEPTFTVTINDPEGASRYCGLGIKNITIGDSPEWLKAAVTAIGMRPINNIVDITNYVMSEIGEPMHAFDMKKLNGNGIIVRFAESGENIVTLDGQDLVLSPEDVVIADAGGAIALAGVMGGGNSEIDDSTTEIILEAANFNPVNIRKTAARHTLRTEAAIRFEKSLDPELCHAAIMRCYELIKEIIPAAEAVGPIVDAYPVKFPKVTIRTTPGFIRKKLGESIGDREIVGILTSLNFSVTPEGEDLVIDVPSYRATKDVSIPDDIVEEVGRIYGFDNIVPKPPLINSEPPEKNKKRGLERTIKTILSRDHNLCEVSNYSFVGEEILKSLSINEDRELRLRNPISSDLDRLRRSLIPNICANIKTNQRFYDYFRIFEVGRVYLKDERSSSDLAQENSRVAGAIFSRKPETPLFYDTKYSVMDLIEQLKVKDVKTLPVSENIPPYAHPVRSMEIIIDGSRAGLIFELHPKIAKAMEIRGSAGLFDLDINAILNAKKKGPSFEELQKFPDVPFEISVIADKLDYARSIEEIILKSSSENIRAVDVLSVYEGDPVPAGKKSISFRIVFAAKERTLGPDEIEKLQNGVIKDLNSSGYNLR